MSLLDALEAAAERLDSEEAAGAEPWRAVARPDQLPPDGDWFVWLILAGRGWGKSRTAAEWCLEKARKYPGARIALVASTAADVRDTMIEGESGLLACLDQTEFKGGSVETGYNRSLGEIFLRNGSRFKGYTAEQPRKLRGPQHHFCFPAGTAIQTPFGEISIEKIKPGDHVVTRGGIRQVTRVTSRFADLVTMTHDYGTLTGTIDHPVWTVENGWTSLAALTPGATLFTWADEFYQETVNGPSTHEDTGISTVRPARSGDTARYGSAPTGLLIQDTTSITKTTYQVTTDSTISRRSPEVSIDDGTRNRAPRASASSVTLSSNVLPRGDHLSTALGARVRTVTVEGRPSSSALTAVQISSPVWHHGVENRRPSAVRGVSTSVRAGVVYNLTVDGEHEYFADDVLVHNCWADEAAYWSDAYKGPITDTTWSNLVIGCRLPRRSIWSKDFQTQIVVATTPRPVALLHTTDPHPSRAGLMQRETTIITRGRTVDNLANLSETYKATVVAPLLGTRLGRQELDGELLEERENALWKREDIDRQRIDPEDLPDLVRVVVGVDPAVSDGETSAQTGIIVAGASKDGHGYVLADYTLRGTPKQAMERVVMAYEQHHADRVVAEVNNGGDYIGTLLRTIDAGIPYRPVRATRGKAVRAEPISALYEQCVVAGSLVETERGSIPIENVTVLDRVWTRNGLRQVLWSGKTGHKPTVTIKTNHGDLACTADHPVYVVGRGFVRGIDLAPTDTLLSWRSIGAKTVANQSRRDHLFGAAHVPRSNVGRRENRYANTLSSRASGTTSVPTIRGITGRLDTLVGSFFTERSMRMRTGRYQTGTSYTMWTTTPRTTTSPTSCCSSGESMPHTTGLRWKTTSDSLWHERNASVGHMLSQLSVSVKNAELLTRHEKPNESCSTAHSDAMASPTVVIAVEDGPSRDVYNLSVESDPEFFANGVLVHNCRVHHAGSFPTLEDEMCMWAPGDEVSPDRMDALVWAFYDLKDLISGSWLDAYGVTHCEECGNVFLAGGKVACPKCHHPIPVAVPT